MNASQEWDQRDAHNKMMKFFRYLSPVEQKDWSSWFESERQLELQCNQPVTIPFFTSTYPSYIASSHTYTSSQSNTELQQDFLIYLPRHIPPLNRLGITEVPELLRAVAPEFPEFRRDQEDIEDPTPSRPATLQPATYTGSRPRQNIEGQTDFQDLVVGDMVMWLRSDSDKSEEYPFWMSKVLQVNHNTKIVRVRWYDKVPLRASHLNAGRTADYAHWSESKWQPWWNVYTDETLERLSKGKRNKKQKAATQSCGRRYEVM